MRPVSPPEGAAGIRHASPDVQGQQGKGARPTGISVLAVYEIVSIKRVAGGIRTSQPHSETKKRRRGTGADEQRASGLGDSEESEECSR